MPPDHQSVIAFTMGTLFAKRSGVKFYDRWESLEKTEREKVIKDCLEEIILYAKHHSPYYADSLKQYDKNSVTPLAQVPVLTPDEFRTLVPPQSRKIVSENQNGYTIFQSGGTTGIPKSTLFSHQELDALDLPNARGFFALGLAPEDRVGNLFAVGSLYMTFVHINRMLQGYGCQNFPFSNHTAPEFIHTVVKLFNVNVLTGISSVVLNALREFRHFGVDGIKIEKVFFGGEHLYEADKREIQSIYGTKMIAAPGYGTVDTWYLGYQCADCPTGVFHAHDDQVYLEIVNEDTQTHTANDAIGMLYATPFLRKLTPVIRYRVGDRARWLNDPCRCGRTTPLFQLLGRGDDVLRIGYDSVDYNAIQSCVLEIPELSGTLQMEKSRREGRDELILRIETDAPVATHELLANQLNTSVLKSRPSLKEFISKNTVHPLKIELLPFGQLPRNPRTGKLIRVVDAIKDS